MPRFELSCVVGVSGYTVVKARTLEEAIEKAKSRPVRLSMSGDADPDECWVVDDADGEPKDINVAA